MSTRDDLMSIKRLGVKVNDFRCFGCKPITTKISHSYRPKLLDENEQINDFYVISDEKNIYAISPKSTWISFDNTKFIDNGVLNSDETITNLALEHSTNYHPHYIRFYLEIGFKIDIYNKQKNIVNTIELDEN
jgi:hypothetical protein